MGASVKVALGLHRKWIPSRKLRAPFGDGFQLHSSWILHKQTIENRTVGAKRIESFRPEERVKLWHSYGDSLTNDLIQRSGKSRLIKSGNDIISSSVSSSIQIQINAALQQQASIFNQGNISA